MSSAAGYIQRRVGSYMSTLMTWLYKKVYHGNFKETCREREGEFVA